MIEGNQNFKVINDAFPHVARKLKFYWGHPEFKTYIDSLQTDASGGARAGFPGEILKALFSLALEHEGAHPSVIPKQADIWSQWR